VPAALIHTTAKAAVLVAAGKAAAGVLSAQVVALTEGVLKAMLATKVKVITLVLLTAGAIGTGAGAMVYQRHGPGPVSGVRQQVAAAALQEQVKPPATSAKPQAAEDKDSIAYGGRVLAPDGRPVAGAKLYLSPGGGYHKRPTPAPEVATTGPDGRFHFTTPKAKFGREFGVVAATAANFGAGWVNLVPDSKRDDLTIHLVDDAVPITGQIVDLEGKPVPGATLRVLQINAAPGEDLGPWLEAAKNKKGLSLALEQEYLPRFTVALCPEATTDAEGRFRLTGIGRNRLVRAQLHGPTIASWYMHILTRPGKAILVVEHEGHPEYREPSTVTTYYGSSFRHVAAPTKPIVGVVRDKDTKKPLAGVTVQSYKLANSPYHGEDIVRTTTDAQGRYRLTGLPKGDSNKIMIVPPDDLPYIAIHTGVPDSPGLDPVTVDVEMNRGVWIEGKLTDKVTGKPIPGGVEYFSLYSNPNLREYPGLDGTLHRILSAKKDGSYRIVGLPGPGLLGVYYQIHPYLRAPDRDDEFGTKERSFNTSPYAILFPSNYNALARINPAKGVDSVKQDVTLDPGWSFSGTIHGPDGKPLTGTRSFHLVGHWWDREATKTAEFTEWFHPSGPREILYQHLENGLVGVAQPPKENGGSVRVRMEPGAAVTGRLVGADGRPLPDVAVEVRFHPKGWGSWFDYFPEPIKTDREGRFRIDTLLPGYEFRLKGDKGVVQLGAAPPSRETKDLGDVRMKREKE
jgi:protocatechuate 3,4-dioxygenase beta subunit